jgi:SAM-dependent methyltransferase
MKDEKRERFPKYTPFYYRSFVKARKIYRQAMVRLAEHLASRKHETKGVTLDGNPSWHENKGVAIIDPKHAINKCAIWMEEDMRLPGISALVYEFEDLKINLKCRGLKYTNTAGTFLSRMFYPRSEETKMWENTWAIYNSGVHRGHKVLDIGGASTIFCFYLGKMGCSVDVVDNDWGNCGTLYNTRYVAKRMKWDIRAHDRDVAKPLPFTDSLFDRVFSICTVEHLTSSVRQTMMREVGRVLKPGGIAAITMCYCNDMQEILVDKGLRFGYREKLNNDIIYPSGLGIYGNTDLVDLFPDENFLGALFLVKKSDG